MLTEQEWLLCDKLKPLVDHLLETNEFSLRQAQLFYLAIWGVSDLSASRTDTEDDYHRGIHTSQAHGFIDGEWKVPKTPPAVNESWELYSLGARALLGRAYGIAALKYLETTVAYLESEALVLFRDIFGNPFRIRNLPERVLAWNSGRVVRISEEIYTSKSYSLLPLLADALEEAGCEDQDIINHCRGKDRCASNMKVLTGTYCPACRHSHGSYKARGIYVCTNCWYEWIPQTEVVIPCSICKNTGWSNRKKHIRGCWVIDLLLKKDNTCAGDTGSESR